MMPFKIRPKEVSILQMHSTFSEFVESLHPSFEKLIDMEPCRQGIFPKYMPKSGVYLFSENGKHLYVGRSKNMRNRYGMHTRPSSAHNQASFAFLLAKEELGLGAASYKTDDQSRVGLSLQPQFRESFLKAKQRVRQMDYRFVEETEPTRQVLLEVYCSVALETPYNDFATH